MVPPWWFLAGLMHDILKGECWRLAMRAALGAVLVWVASRGYVIRRRNQAGGHGVFDFDAYSWFDWLGVLVGLAIAGVSLFRLRAAYSALRRAERTMDERFFLRAGVPLKVYRLLLAIAAADGRTSESERELVLGVMLREWPERILPQDLRNWAGQVESPEDPVQLAHGLAPLLSAAERLRVLAWCRRVAAVDGGGGGKGAAAVGLVTKALAAR